MRVVGGDADVQKDDGELFHGPSLALQRKKRVTTSGTVSEINK